ncbi:type 1 fimbrial protein [Providencia rettgeri]
MLLIKNIYLKTYYILLLVAILLLLTFETYSNVIDRHWGVDGLNGELYVHGELLESPCTLDEDSLEQEFSLGESSTAQFRQVGDMSLPLLINLKFKGCGINNGVAVDEFHSGNLIYTPDEAVIKLRFNGIPDKSDSKLFKVNGGVKGIAILLEDNKGKTIIPNKNHRPMIISKGKSGISFTAQIIKTNNKLEVGKFNSVINISLEYK